MSDAYEATALFLRERVLKLEAENAALTKDAERAREVERVFNDYWQGASDVTTLVRSLRRIYPLIDAAMEQSHE